VGEAVSAGGFVKVPTALLYNPDVSDGALRAYMALARYAISCSSDTFELTADALGTLLGRGRDQAARRLGELERLGLVVIVDRHRGRARPNRITVLDPQDVVFAGLHVARSAADLRHQVAADVRHPDAADLRHPYKKEERTRVDRGQEENHSPPPVDNGGAPRPPRRDRCTIHEAPGSWTETTECRGCVADAKAAGWSRSPAF
jgi:hypothetical protein